MANRNLGNLPAERPIDQLHRHDTAIRLLEEHAEDQEEINTRQDSRYEKLADELRAMRERYNSNQRYWILGWQASRVAARWLLYIGAAAGGWAWTHWTTIEAALYDHHDTK